MDWDKPAGVKCCGQLFAIILAVVSVLVVVAVAVLVVKGKAIPLQALRVPGF
jgi:hypothetical protein